METILRVFQFFLAISLIGVVLLQRSEGGGLGIGSSGGAGSFMSVRGTANFLTRVTAILAALFMLTCLVLALLAKPSSAPRSIFDTPVAPAPAAPTSNELAPVPPPAQGATDALPAPAQAVPEQKTPAAPEPVAPAPAAIAPSPAPAAEAPPAPQSSAPIKPSQTQSTSTPKPKKAAPAGSPKPAGQ